jgi:hypothetical protein
MWTWMKYKLMSCHPLPTLKMWTTSMESINYLKDLITSMPLGCRK